MAASSDAESLLLTGTALDMASMQNDNVMQRTARIRSGVQGVDLAGLNVQAGERRIAGDSLNAVSRPILSPVLDSVLNRGETSDGVRSPTATCTATVRQPWAATTSA